MPFIDMFPQRAGAPKAHLDFAMTRWYKYDTVLSKPYSFWKFLMFSKFRVKKPTKPLEKGEPVFFRKLLLKVVAFY